MTLENPKQRSTIAVPRHLEQLLAHAEAQLAATGMQRPTDVLPVYKKFLKIEEHRLRLKHQAGGGGHEICKRRVNLVDVLLRHVFAAAAAAVRAPSRKAEKQLGLIALGGYGRGELNPSSDVDVMLLHAGNHGKISSYIEQMAEQILYLLWDIGFKVGHSTHSVKEAIAQANFYSSDYLNFSGLTVTAVFFIFLTIPLARFTDHIIKEREKRERAQAV